VVTDEAAGQRVANDRRLPPVTEIAVASLALIVAGGIYLAAHLPDNAPLAPAIALLAGAAALTMVNVLALARVRELAWEPFLLVARWTVLAYIVIAGMLEYVFVIDGTRGSQLLVLSLMLVVFAVDIPIILAFSVARYQGSGQKTGSQ
jgi:membrane-bound acyltransferase YfiQ involved in biofilm formation